VEENSILVIVRDGVSGNGVVVGGDEVDAIYV